MDTESSNHQLSITAGMTEIFERYRFKGEANVANQYLSGCCNVQDTTLRYTTQCKEGSGNVELNLEQKHVEQKTGGCLVVTP